MDAGTVETRVLTDRDWVHIARRLGVSPQQGQILRLMVEEDLTPEGIAARLGGKESSVKKQIERMYKKLAVHSRWALAWRVFGEVLRMMRNGTDSIRSTPMAERMSDRNCHTRALSPRGGPDGA